MSSEPHQPRGFALPYSRRWCPAGAGARLRLFAAPPPRTADCVDLLDVSDTPCLVLLGEAGSGKTWELHRLHQRLRDADERVDILPGREIAKDSDPERLFRSGNADLWAHGLGSWHVLIDGVDEIAAGLDDPAAVLGTFLDRLLAAVSPVRSLFVVMTSRTASWSEEFDSVVDARWATDRVRKLVLEPLDEADIGFGISAVEPDAAKSEQLSRLILDQNLGSIAGRPLLLDMMLEHYQATGILPGSQSALFKGVIDTQLDGAGQTNWELDASQRRLLAGRIAAASAFSGMIRIATSPVPAGSDSLVITRIAGGAEPSPRGRFAVTPTDLVYVLESSLFVTTGTGQYEFRHRAFRDYLTARYLIDHRLSAEEILSLLAVQEVNGPGGVAPPLQEVAAWAAAMMPTLFDLLIAREPDVLLRSDAAVMKAEDRARLTAAVLARFASEDLLDQHDALVPLFLRLDHDDLARQLEPLITGAGISRSARMIAIDIAGLTEKTELVPSLLATARDGFADALVRTWAVRAVGRIGSEVDIQTLAPILAGDLSTDGEDRLRGALLRLCWPQYLEFHELLAALTPPKERNHIGTYHLFLRRLRIVDLMPAQAVQAVRWVQGRIAGGRQRNDGLQPVMGRFFWVAAAKIEFAEVRSVIADLIIEAGADLPNFLSSDRESGEDWSPRSEARSALVVEAITRSPDPIRTTSAVLYFLPDLVRPGDLDAYLASLPQADRIAVRTSLAQIIVALCDQHPFEELSRVWEAADGVSELLSILTRRYSVDLNSDAAEWMREEASRAQETDAQREQAAQVTTRWRDRVLTLLDRIEGGDAESWWRLNYELMQDASGHRSDFEFRSDLTATPGWGLLDEVLRGRVVASAPAYLNNAQLVDTSWLGSNTSHRPANAGVRALRLLQDRAPTDLAALSNETWAAWTPALISFFDNAFYDTEGAQRALAQEAYRRAPDAVLNAIREIALGPRSKGLTARTFELLQGIAHTPVVALLEGLRSGPGLRGANAEASIFSFLVRIGAERAVAEVTTALESGFVEGDGAETDGSGPLTKAAAQLVIQGSMKAWGLLLQLRARNADRAASIWREVADEAAFAPLPILEELDAFSLGQAYIDLAELLPERPPVQSGARVLGVPDHVARFRTMIVGRLVVMGTNAALQQLEHIATSIGGEREALRWKINEARRNVRSKTAVRPDPSEILVQISAMGEMAGDTTVLASTPASAFADDTDDVPIEMDIPAPDPEPSGLLPEEQRRMILAVATEWASASGGISTLNRELCKALAALGHTVACLVLNAVPAEVDDAYASGVTLVICPASEGIERKISFLLCDERALGMRPELVIGHDHITGHYGKALASRFDARYVHFLHTIPQENELLKTDRNGVVRPILSGDVKSEAQVSLASVADLIVAVGPRIFRLFCQETPKRLNIVTFIPGLNDILLQLQPQLNPILLNQCLMIGRMEDAGVKGVQLACDFMRAVVQGRIWPSGETPKLRIRGFSTAGADMEIEAIEDFKTNYAAFVYLNGYSTDAAALQAELGKTGVFVMPSLAEGFGLTGFEAIAAGIPVILSAESGLAEFLNSEVLSGYLPQSLVDASVAPVALSYGDNIPHWQTRVEAVLTNRVTAFHQADHMRNALKSRYSWDAAARRLSKEFEDL